MAKKAYARIACPKVLENGDPCEADVLVWLEGEKGTGEAWIGEYRPQDCTHEYDDLSAREQDEAFRSAIDWSMTEAEEGRASRFDSHEEREMFERDMRGW